MELLLWFADLMRPYGTQSYFVMFGVLIACGFGFPMPEDIVLIAGGLLASQEIVNEYVVFVVTMAGVLMGDSSIYFLGRRYGENIKNIGIFKKIITPSRSERIEKALAKYGDKVIFIARFLPGLRTPIFLSTGIYRVPYWKFLALDGFAALISVPAWIWVGYAFGNNLEALEKKISQMQMGLYSILGIVIVLIILIFWIKKKFKSKIEI